MTAPRSWGHTVQRIPVDHPAYDTYCTIRHCPGTVTHLETYYYVTGRNGLTAWRKVYVCGEHAERFRAKHDLPEPVEAPVPKHALEQIVGGEAS